MLSRNHLALFFTHSAIAKGEAYQREGRVTGLEVSEDWGQVRAGVHGSRHEDYDVKIELTWKAGRIRTVEGVCSCPMNYNCKHVAAALLQAFAVLLPVKTVGVMGDGRTYDHVCALRAVTSTDGMTADFYPFESALLGRMATRIVNEVRGINRVVYDCTSKPPGTIEWE